MKCLNDEQLAEVAIWLDENGALGLHVEQCEACREKLVELRRFTEPLTAAHAELDRTHAAARARLMASLSSVELSTRPTGIWSRLKRGLAGLTPRQRIAASGLGLSTAVGLLLLLLVVANSATSLSAMERIAKAVREVKSYSYKMFIQDTFVRKGDTQPSTVTHTATTYWLEPRSLFYEEKLVKYEGVVPEGEGELLTHLAGIHPTGQPGMLVFHAGTGRATESMAKTYYWVPELPSMSAEDIGTDSPITRLRMVREGAGEVLRELGTKVIDGKQARGYVMALKDAKPESGFDSLEVWVDPATDLPLELWYEHKDDKVTQIFRITDCRWNIEIDPKLFNATPPEGYEDITPPSDDQAIAEMVAALKLYAELSGGNHPRATTFDPDAIHREMLKMAGFTGQPQKDWTKLRQLQQTTIGLKWIALVLRNGINAGYYGADVSSQDKDKVLLWWRVVPMESTHEFSYRVFYGDLRTEVLPLDKWSKLVPEEAAQPHLPQPEEAQESQTD
jgi:outer membrane lipoprotein-sorting protein